MVLLCVSVLLRYNDLLRRSVLLHNNDAVASFEAVDGCCCAALLHLFECCIMLLQRNMLWCCYVTSAVLMLLRSSYLSGCISCADVLCWGTTCVAAGAADT